jgi:transposase-like protein
MYYIRCIGIGSSYMAQAFSLSAAARTLSLRSIYEDGETAAYHTFRKLRWADTAGAAVCPSCGCVDVYEIASRRRFECSGCAHQFSVTSGTIFHGRKKSFTDLLAAMCIIMNAAKGLSALQLARDLKCQHKSAWILAHKIRQAIAAETSEAKLSGEIEIDGMYHGGKIRPANLKENRVDRRRARVQKGTRRVVIALRVRKGRTHTFIGKHEPEGVAIARRIVTTGSTIIADEATHWDVLPFHYATQRINHSVAYSLDGISTNQVESFFSRLRRMIEGQHHYVSPQYLHQYAAHAAWLEDHRGLDNGSMTKRALGLALNHPKSEDWCGYWQRKAK